MNSPLGSSAKSGDLVEQAHAVLARLPRAEQDVLEHPDVIAFMALSAQHRDTMLRVARVWGALGAVNPLPWPSPAELAADDDDDDDDEDAGENVAPNASRRISRRRFLPWAAALAALAIGLWSAERLYDRTVVSEYATAVGEHRTIELPDGSIVHLGARTRLSTRFAAQERNIVLETGEALFEVAHDPQRPFKVRSGDAMATAIGTAFDVRHGDAHTSVAVVEGVVDVSVDGGTRESLKLGAGEQVSIAAGALGSIVQRDSQDIVGWRTGRFTYIGEPLPAVLADLSRYSAQSLDFEGAASNRLIYTGVVAREHIDDWLTALEATFPVTVARSNGRVIVRERPR